MTHLTMLALAELAPASRWWDWHAFVENELADRRACGWERSRGEVTSGIVRENLHLVTCPACLVLLDAALEMETP